MGANKLSISSNHQASDFNIATGANVTISGLTITQGNSSTNGGGIINNGTLTLTNDALTNNTAALNGGAIDNEGSLTLNNSSLSGNTANSGGALFNNVFGTLSVNLDTFSQNTAQSGGAIESDGTLTVTNTSFKQNQATAAGGAISIIATTPVNTTISGSTFSANTAINGAGAIFNSGNLTLTNDTLSGNTATSSTGFGGGIANLGALTLNSDTINLNKAAFEGGGIYNLASSTVNVHDTIVAQNTAPTGADLFGSFTSQGFNLIGIEDLNATGFTNGKNRDMVGTTAKPINPELGALQNNGGSTFTEALLTGSPAINTGDLNNANNPTTDQRGTARPQRGRADIGAFELV